MNTETMDKVTEIIGSLCEKLGTTAQYLIPEMAKMYTADSLFWMIAWIAVFIVALIILPFAYKAKKENDGDTFAILLVINVLFILVALICGLCCASDLVKWTTSPTAMAISTLMNKVLLLKNS